MQAGSQSLSVRLLWRDVVTEEGREYYGTLPITFGRGNYNTIILNSHTISRRHARLVALSGKVFLQDNQSLNGTFVNQERISSVTLQSGSRFQIGPFHFTMIVVPVLPQESPPQEQNAPIAQSLSSPGAPTSTSDAESSLVFSRLTGALIPYTREAAVEKSVKEASFSQAIVTIQEVYRRQWPVPEVTYLSIGAGLGSFTWIDHLLIHGATPDQVAALGIEPRPTSRFERLAHNSQIPDGERLRSNSDACPDNIWGWPSYGLREIWQALKQGNLKHALHIAAWVFGEPVLTDTYTPRAGDVVKSLEREARRIGWERTWHYGWAQGLRKLDDGRYVVAYIEPNVQGASDQKFVIARYIHLAMGYPGIRLLPDLQDYRKRTQDFTHTVNAYEEHDHIYQHLLKNGGVVIVRGRGIVASRVIQRLYEVRQENKSIVILHVHRSPLATGHRDGHARRRVEHHIELQPFNWPKACWTGSLRQQLEQANDQQRDQMLNDWGGTSTADRRAWRQIIQLGLREGWYQIYFGAVKRIERTAKGQLFTHLSIDQPDQPEVSLTADFMIDCTGLEATLENNPLLKDLVDCYRLGLNPKGRLRMSNDFEVQGMENGPGRIFASGVATLGGPQAVVDSFLGMQYAALRSVEKMIELNAPGLRLLSPGRSFSQWLRWVRGVHP